MQNKGNELPKEHILVCLSSSPSNERIVRMAGKMAQAFRGSLTALYVQTPGDADMNAEDTVRLHNYYVIAPYILCGLMDTTCGMVRGLGRAWLPMLVSLTGACLLRIVWIWTFFRWTHTLEMLYISYPISWIVTAAVHAVCYFVIWKKLRAKLEQAAPQTEQA